MTRPVPSFRPIPLLFALALVFVAALSANAAPDRRLDVLAFGAVADGTTLNTAALQRAIDTCSADGGGTLTFPAGRYLTGTLQLKDNVTLHLDADAVLLGSTTAADYRNLDPFIDGTGSPLGYALIVAVDAKHVGLEGPGTIEGQGAALKAAQTPYKIRPFLVRWVRCTDVAVKDVHLGGSGAWTMHLFQCRDARVEHVTIRSRGLANNDGIDIDSSERVRIAGCDIDTGDDAICLKATGAQPCRDIAVTGCRLTSNCAAIKLGTESLGDFEKIRIDHCQIRDTRLGGVKLLSVDGADLHDVVISDLTMDNVAVPVFVRLGARLKTFRTGDQAKPPGRLRDVTLKNIRATNSRQIGLFISGVPGHPVENLTFENLALELAGGGQAEDASVALPEKESAYPEITMFGAVMPASGIYARHVRGVNFTNVTTTVKSPDARPAIALIDAERVTPVNFSPVTAEATKPNPSLTSPDGKLAVEFKLNAAHAPVYLIRREGQIVLQESRLGLVRDDADFSTGLTLVSESNVEPVEDRYELLTAKRRLNVYRANRKVFHLAAATGQKLDVIFQVSDDGVAFRYFFPETSTEARTLKEDVSSFHFLPDTKAWLQPMSVAKSGWKSTNPSYEEYYQKEIAAGTPSTLGAGWVFPALFHSGETWLLVSEGSLARGDCGARLRHESPGGDYTVGLPDARETLGGQPVNPSSRLPWLTPWRLIAVGSLKTIAESTLGTDLAEKPAGPADAAIKPGKAAWSWPLLGDKQTNYDVQKRFIDYAADMGWAYCLIDALWDTQIGYEKIGELADYARGKNVRLLLWYNSNGTANDAPQTPKDRMLTHETRVQEFTRLKAMGIAGLKIDFFGGDGRPVIDYYRDLLDDAAPFGLLMNFHGATLPRGWQRTYPHLMTMEAIRGLEFVTFEQKNADEEPTHAATIPFTRNVFDPMDFTPVVLDRIRKIERRTTAAFELALAVVFTSGIQHYAEIPEGMAKMPAYVQDFIRHVPSVWDDTKFVDGYPGKFAVIARRGDAHWQVAGINGEATERNLTLDLSSLPSAAEGQLITDGEGEPFAQRTVKLGAGKKFAVTLKPHGGFVLILK